MKITPTSTQRVRYRDIFDLAADEVGRIAIGTPTRVRLHANRGEAAHSLSRTRHDVSTTPCAARTALRTLD
ncbi:hypothetical protein [Burkholderia anthina]|uniref:hypothetical protein n=1 Tax=Burkholderia anthina TaxID=179879 RepID=UPI0029305349|nr:hypothetical protein [Burkholderia anthina]WJN72269.1 hypothetical protein OH687_39730 [Burkholderia anthina]